MAGHVEVSPEGGVMCRQRHVGAFSKPLNLRDFPFDKHVFQLHFVAPWHQSNQIRFVPDPRFVAGGLKHAAGIANGIFLLDWKILGLATRDLPYTLIAGYDTPGYAFSSWPKGSLDTTSGRSSCRSF